MLSSGMGKNKRQLEYLEAYFNCSGNKSKAGEVTNTPKATYNRWFREDKDFHQKSQSLLKQLESELLEIAIKRATSKSDTLLIFLLKAANPEKFCEKLRAIKATGLNSASSCPIPQITIIPSKPEILMPHDKLIKISSYLD